MSWNPIWWHDRDLLADRVDAVARLLDRCRQRLARTSARRQPNQHGVLATMVAGAGDLLRDLLDRLDRLGGGGWRAA